MAVSLAGIKSISLAERVAGVFSRTKLPVVFLVSFLGLFSLLNYSEASPTPKTKRSQSEQKFHFGHKLLVHPIGGLPSSLFFAVSDADQMKVRALLELDGRLISVPMGYGDSDRVFHTEFPTPQESLRYRFQLVIADGRAVVTPQYEITPSCESGISKKELESATAFSSQRELLSEAIDRDKDVLLLNYVLSAIDSVAGGAE